MVPKQVDVHIWLAWRTYTHHDRKRFSVFLGATVEVKTHANASSYISALVSALLPRYWKATQVKVNQTQVVRTADTSARRFHSLHVEPFKPRTIILSSTTLIATIQMVENIIQG